MNTKPRVDPAKLRKTDIFCHFTANAFFVTNTQAQQQKLEKEEKKIGMIDSKMNQTEIVNKCYLEKKNDIISFLLFQFPVHYPSGFINCTTEDG